MRLNIKVSGRIVGVETDIEAVVVTMECNDDVVACKNTVFALQTINRYKWLQRYPVMYSLNLRNLFSNRCNHFQKKGGDEYGSEKCFATN